MPPSSMKAVKVVSTGKAEVQEVTLPKLRDDYVLVKTKAVALNPTDWKHVYNEGMAIPGCTVGCDYSGVVEEVGDKVEKQWKKGDRIAGFVHGVNALQKEDGAFGQYLVAKGDIQLKVPDNTTDEEAATLGVGVVTCGQGLYQSLELPLPGSGKAGIWLLVYGGSTATGSLAIQYAIHSGCNVITTCSPHNFPFVKSLGVTEAFDYKDPDCGKKALEQIREFTKDNLTKAFDCISEGSSPNICANAISSRGGEISYLLPAKHDRDDVKNKHTLGYTAIGEDKQFRGKDLPAKPEDLEFAKKFWEISSKLIASAQLAVHPPKVGKEGLQGTIDGMDQLRQGKVTGVKLVYRVDETP